ncbi:archease [Candidatus Woesearchaeota archaeon]|nr:archease [Candidatus Woesearchaeota archaeon]
MKPYTFLDHTADVLFEAYGETLDTLFQNAALALQESQFSLKTIKPKKTKTIRLKNEKIEMLLFSFLQELIFLKDAEQFAVRSCKVAIKETKGGKGFSLTASCLGDKLDLKKQGSKVDAKAITFHQFSVGKEKGRWKARVIVDI